MDSLDGVTSGSSGLSKEWVGLILLPIVGNAAEHVTAVTVSVKDKLNLSIGVAVGSSIVSFLIDLILLSDIHSTCPSANRIIRHSVSDTDGISGKMS